MYKPIEKSNSMDKIVLSENHPRSVSSSMQIIEKMVNEIEKAILFPGNGVTIKSVNDMEKTDFNLYIKGLDEVKKQIKYMAEKYDLRMDEVKLSRLINSRKAKMWETITDTTSRKLKGYKDFPKETAEEFDADINRLRMAIELL